MALIVPFAITALAVAATPPAANGGAIVTVVLALWYSAPLKITVNMESSKPEPTPSSVTLDCAVSSIAAPATIS